MSEARVGKVPYCAPCREALRLATRGAQLRTEPGECFARFIGGGRWAALHGGGPAHWLAHELGVCAAPRREACAGGYALELDELLDSRRELSGAPPRPGDLWIDLDGAGCGVVSTVRSDSERGLAISVRHLRSSPTQVCVEDFYFQLHGRGRFFR